MNARTFFLLTLLGISILLVIFINRPGEKPAASADQFKHSFYLQDFTLTRFDSTGQRQYTLQGEQIEQDAASGESHLTRPQATFFRNDTVHWTASAEKGWLNREQTRGRLESNVVLQETVPPKTRATTATLELNLTEQIAENSVPVQVIQGKNQLQGTGLIAWLNQNRLQLKSDVRGVYVP